MFGSQPRSAISFESKVTGPLYRRKSGPIKRLFRKLSAVQRCGDSGLMSLLLAAPDMADPAGAARRARAALKPDGHCLLVEPFAGDSVADNLNPVGRRYYGASLICVPVSLAQKGPALGAQAGEQRLRKEWSTTLASRVSARDGDPVQLDLRGSALSCGRGRTRQSEVNCRVTARRSTLPMPF